jgi:hypothetical protein
MRQMIGLGILLGVLGTAPAAAQDMPPVYVGGEEETVGHKNCNITYKSAVAAVESALRYNNVKVATQTDYYGDDAIKAYVNLASLGASANCALSYSLEMQTSLSVAFPRQLGLGTRFSLVVLCNKGGIMTGPSYDLQDRLNNSLRDYVDQCVGEITRPKP